MKAEHAPPANLTDPFVRRAQIDRATWTRAIRGRIPETRDVAVAHTLAGYGNKDGSNCHPGVQRLVDDLCSSAPTVKRGLSWLAEHGWITIQQKGVRKLGQADTYMLTVPAPLAVEMNVWEDGGPQWMERPRDEPKRRALQVTGDTKNGRVAGVIRDTKKRFLGITDPVLGITEAVLGITGEPPPGPRHQVLDNTSPIGSIGLTADASRQHANGHPNEPFDPDDPDVIKKIEERLEEEYGAVRSETANLVDSMASRGAHPVAILNAARAYERDLESA